MQTSETALLFLQLIMRKLRRGKHRGRAAVVVPSGVLFGDGIATRIKEQLLREFNLHTIVRLPNGVFSPYTFIPTNILFFNTNGPSNEVWYYELQLPEGRKSYTKTAPLQFADFAECMAWWPARQENRQAWRVTAEDLVRRGFDLDLRNPNAVQTDYQRDPEVIATMLTRRSSELAIAARALSADLQKLRSRFEAGRPETLGNLVTVRGGGTPSKTNPAFWTGEVPWVSPKDMKRRELCDAADHISEFAAATTAARLIPPGTVLVVVRGMILAHTFPTAVLRVPAAINQDMKALLPNADILPEYLNAFFWTYNHDIVQLVERSTHDTRKLTTSRLLAIAIPVIPMAEQVAVAEAFETVQQQIETVTRLQHDLEVNAVALLPSIVGGRSRPRRAGN